MDSLKILEAMMDCLRSRLWNCGTVHAVPENRVLAAAAGTARQG